jgi:SAM-dependent methyltransferase
VGWTSSRAEFLSVGRRIWADLYRAIDEAGAGESRDWLDFGCGAGRVARHAVDHGTVLRRLTGVDVDRDATSWCRQHLLGRYETIRPDPPTDLSGNSFDVVYSISVFTHLPEVRQDAWLAELRRLLRPGGIFVATTHSPDLTWTRPDLTPQQLRALTDEGFLFAPSGRGFNEDSAFHTPDYLRRRWGGVFEFEAHRIHGLAGYQDISVWRKA